MHGGIPPPCIVYFSVDLWSYTFDQILANILGDRIYSHSFYLVLQSDISNVTPCINAKNAKMTSFNSNNDNLNICT